MTKNSCGVKLKNISLVYDLYYDRTNSLKEYVINLFSRKRYVDARVGKFHALKNCTLSIEHGERVGVIGLNGSGKSTLLKVISGLLKPTTGEIEITGSVQPLIEMGAGFNPEFSGRDNIYLNGAMLGFTRRQIKKKEREIIEFTDLGNFIDIPVKYYSSGMITRLAFTIATIIDPEILLIDEVLSTGDIQFVEKAKGRIDKLITSAKILVLVSHDLEMIRSLTRRVIVLSKGEVLYDGNSKSGIVFYRDMVGKKQ
jgi:ABC-type polysaccharide/polyol phosphate transport system ATPase subunit